MIQRIHDHYVTHRKQLVKQAYSTLGDSGYAEDCVQETYERALKYYAAYSEGNFEGWFFGIFRNTVRDYLSYIRNNGMSQQFEEDGVEEERVTISSVNKLLLFKEVTEYSAEELTTSILTLYYLQGYSAKAVSILTGATVFKIYNIANKFKNSLEEKYS